MLGPNGAGKSTLIKAIAGLVPIFAGTRACSTARTSPRCRRIDLVRHGLAFVPQTENIFAGMTVDDNLALAAAILPRARAARRGSPTMYAFFPDLAGSGRARSPGGCPAASGRCWRSPAR